MMKKIPLPPTTLILSFLLSFIININNYIHITVSIVHKSQSYHYVLFYIIQLQKEFNNDYIIYKKIFDFNSVMLI